MDPEPSAYIHLSTTLCQAPLWALQGQMGIFMAHHENTHLLRSCFLPAGAEVAPKDEEDMASATVCLSVYISNSQSVVPEPAA